MTCGVGDTVIVGYFTSTRCAGRPRSVSVPRALPSVPWSKSSRLELLPSHNAVRPLRGRCVGAGGSAGRTKARCTRPRATHGYFIDRSAVAESTAGAVADSSSAVAESTAPRSRIRPLRGRGIDRWRGPTERLNLALQRPGLMRLSLVIRQRPQLGQRPPGPRRHHRTVLPFIHAEATGQR